MKYYGDEGEHVFGVEYWQQEAYDKQAPVIVESTKRAIKTGDGMMWCKFHSEFVEKGCSEGCQEYTPCNGISGRCTNYTWAFINTGIKYSITENGCIRRVK
jgi:hypothetical protein